jgi:uncharacterized protein YbbC (DUF1343 family)
LAEALAKAHKRTSEVSRPVRFVPTRFTPTSSTYAGKECGGVQIYLDDWNGFSSSSTGLTIACELRRLYPNDWKARGYQKLLAHPPTYEALTRGDSPEQIGRLWQTEIEAFLKIRRKYLLY